MRSLNIAAAALTLAVAVAAGPAVSRGRTPPTATPVGPSVGCVQLTQIRETHVYGDDVIDFRMRGGKVYRNTLPNRCPTLGFEERFLYKTSLSQLCSVDIITVLQSPGLSQGPSCGLGRFQPVEIVKTARR